MSTPIAQPAPSWRVLTSVEDLDTSNPSNPVPSQRITFTVVDSGVTGSVLVPDTRVGDIAYVRSVIAAKAMQLAAVAGLSSE